MGLFVAGAYLRGWGGAYLLTSLNVSSGMGLSVGRGERGAYLRNSTVAL